MSVNVIAELHPIKRNRIKVMVTPKPIAEIITELGSGFPLSQARVCKNGEIIKDFSIKAEEGDTLWIKFVPYGSPQEAGGAMKGGGGLLVALGVLTVGLLGWTGVGGFLGAALIGSGISMMLGGAVLMNTNIPSVKDREQPEQDPSIRGARNQSRPHGRIPVLFGRHRIYPDLAANQHTEIIGGSQYFTQLFCGGYKDCAIDLDSFKLGDTSIIDFSQTRNINSILAGSDPVIRMEIIQNGEKSNIYPNCVHEITVNAPLRHLTDEELPGEIIRTTPDRTDSINVDIFFHNGIGRYNDEGDLLSASVAVRASFKRADEPDSSYQSLGFFGGSSETVSGAELRTMRFQITRSQLAPAAYTVKIERATPDSEDARVIDQVHVGSIRAVKSVRPIREERQRHLTIVALRVLATSRLNGVLDSFNYIAKSVFPVYSGAGSGALHWLEVRETQNPAAALLYALQGRPAQQTVDPCDIEWESLENFYTWCEEREYACNAYLSDSVTIGQLIRMIGCTSRADILRIDSKISVVQDIKRPAHYQLFTPKNTIAYTATMFNADVPDAMSLRFIDEDAGYAQNALQVYNTPCGNRPGEPDSIQRVDIWGVTNSVQARRIGMYNYACLKHRPFVHTIEADIEYLVVNKGDWVQYAGDIALAGTTQGRIKGVVWADGVIIGIDTDEPIEMTEGRQHAVRIRLSNGSIILKEVVFSPGRRREKSTTYHPGESEDLFEPFIGEMRAVGKDNVFYEPENMMFFTEPMKPQDAPKAGDIYAFGIRGYEVLDLIITDIQPGSGLSAVLTCVEYSLEIFAVDEPDFVLPEFINRITPVSGAVDSGLVTPSRWSLFTVFHDGVPKPPRPTGEGQNDGWHRTPTWRTNWQSTKTAPSVDQGEWGPPISLRGRDGTAPHIGSNGNWWIGNVDTGIMARGDDGLTPRIGDNGNWWIGNVDTGICAEAKDGTTPHIGSNGNWWIGSVDTGIKAEGRDGVTPVFLTISPQNKILECDDNGVPLVGILPFTSQARLFNGNTLITNDITWSVPNSPNGVSINAAGLVTVAVGAALADETEITVRAVWTSRTFETRLFISKERRSASPRYLGTVQALTLNSSTVTIVAGPVRGTVRARQGDFILAIAAVGSRRPGSVFQWTGVAWEFRTPENHADLYIRSFKDGLDVPGLANDTEWFGALFARLLVAQQAFIEELQTQVITLKQGGVIQSENFLQGQEGFRIRANGEAEFFNGMFRGRIEANNGYFENLNGTNLNIYGGRIQIGSLTVSDDGVGAFPERTFPATTTIRSIVQEFGTPGTWRDIVLPAGGRFGNQNFTRIRVLNPNLPFFAFTLFNGNTVVRDFDTNSPTSTIGQIMIFNGVPAGRTFRLVNLPTTGNAPSGTVWRDGNNFLRIVP